MRADYDLDSNISLNMFTICEPKLTAWLLPGSLTVANCSSLYFSNAGPSCEIILGLVAVRALISVAEVQFPIHNSSFGEDLDTCNNICELQQGQRVSDLETTIITSPGGAPSTNAETVVS